MLASTSSSATSQSSAASSSSPRESPAPAPCASPTVAAREGSGPASVATSNPDPGNGVSHPLTGAFPTALIQAAVKASGRCAQPNGEFQVDNGWQITATLQIWSGHFQGTGFPALITISGSTATFYGMNINGAPGGAYVAGVKGDWVLLRQGYGYEAFNDRTKTFSRADANGNLMP